MTIRLERASKRYGNVTVVKDLDLEIVDGEFFTLLGASGSGKTTTLRLIAGLESADNGEIIIGDRQVNNLPPKDRDIAMVFQNYALYPHMSVYDNIAFGLKLRKFDKATIDRRVKEKAEMLGITPYLKRKPKELSGGQRQRVALGRALVREGYAVSYMGRGDGYLAEEDAARDEGVGLWRGAFERPADWRRRHRNSG